MSGTEQFTVGRTKGCLASWAFGITPSLLCIARCNVICDRNAQHICIRIHLSGHTCTPSNSHWPLPLLK